VSRRSLGPTQPPVQWVTGALFLGVRRPGRDGYHSPPSNARVKELVELYIHSPNTPLWRCAQLKHRDKLPLPFIYKSYEKREKRYGIKKLYIKSNTKTVAPHMTDPPTRQGGCPTTDNTQISLNKLKHCHDSEAGLEAKTDGRTD
jgi:hypothetical protein